MMIVKTTTSMQEFNISRIITHPEYNKPRRYMNDIALIRLEKPAKPNGRSPGSLQATCASDYVSPVCLPFPSLLASDPPPGTWATVAGWGAIDQFAQVSWPVLCYATLCFILLL